MARERSERESARAARKAARSAAARPAPSLEEVTLDPHGPFRPGYTPEADAWNVKVVTYQCGLIEASAFTGYSSIPKQARSSDGDAATIKVVPAGAVVESKERFDTSIARSRAICRRRVLALDADHMLTLTKRGKFETVADLWAAFRLFSQSMKRRFGDRWRYVAVPELHADGETFHMHVAMKGFFWVGTLRRFWMKALGGAGTETGVETPGNVDAKHFKPRGRASAAGSVAGYVAKYVGKSVCGFARHGRVFAASAGLDPVAVEKWSSLELFGCRDAAIELQRFLCGAGASARGSAWFFNRGRLAGFRLTTERETRKC